MIPFISHSAHLLYKRAEFLQKSINDTTHKPDQVFIHGVGLHVRLLQPFTEI